MLEMLKKNIIMVALMVVVIGGVGIYGISKINVNEVIAVIYSLPYFIKVIAMMGLMALQIVIAFIPGEPLELACGYLFGGHLGTVICLLGSMLGTVIVFQLAKLFHHHIIEVMFNQKKVNEVQKILSSQKSKFWIFVIFMIPGSPKDVMTYLANLTGMSLRQWLVLTTIGRIPSIVTSTYLAGSLKDGNIVLALMILVVTIILVTGGAIYYQKIIKANEKEE